MNMLLGFISRAIAGTAKKTATGFAEAPQVRTELVSVTDRWTGETRIEVRPVLNARRLKSRGKGGKTAHSFSGVRAVKRAAAKRRNKKG